MAYNRLSFRNHPYICYPVNPYSILSNGANSSRGFQQSNQHAMARQGAVSLEEIIKSKIANFRRWKQTKLCRRHQQWSFQFSVMTYNILSQRAAECHRNLYRHCSPTFFQENYRISRLIPEILNSKSDIICLQEVEQHLYDNRIKQYFDVKGFESIFKKRTGDKSDGCAIIWRRKKFNLLRYLDIEFKANGNKNLDRDNVGLIAVLKPNHPNSRNTQVNVATTHLLFNPRRGDVKLCQLRLLLAELERLSLKEIKGEERVYHPTILCGDFNIEPHSSLYQFIESGLIDLTDAQSGDLSGQKVKGKRGINLDSNSQLSLDNMGISKSSRYERISKISKKMPDSYKVSKSSNSEPSTVFANNFQPSSGSHLTNKREDLNLLSAIGSSNDPRWLQTLMSLGQQQLASEVASRIMMDKNSHSQFVCPAADANKPSDESNDETDYPSNEIIFTHDFKFVPVYKFHNHTKKDMPITSMVGKDFNTVDQIFYSVHKKQSATSFSEGKLKLLGLYSLLQKEELLELGGLPNAYLGSDHISLIAQFGMHFKR